MTEKTRQTAAVQKDDPLAGSDLTISDGTDEAGEGATGVDRVQNEPFGPGGQRQRNHHRVGEFAVSSTDLVESDPQRCLGQEARRRGRRPVRPRSLQDRERHHNPRRALVEFRARARGPPWCHQIQPRSQRATGPPPASEARGHTRRSHVPRAHLSPHTERTRDGRPVREADRRRPTRWSQDLRERCRRPTPRWRPTAHRAQCCRCGDHLWRQPAPARRQVPIVRRQLRSIGRDCSDERRR